MKKRFYSIFAVAAAVAVSANAQAVIDADMEIAYPADEGDFAGETDIIIAGATVTFANEAMNTCAFPFTNGNETVTLMEGGKVKFFDSPETAYPNPRDFTDMEGANWSTYMQNGDGSDVTAIPFNWIIEGTGNEIYLDSYCTLGGTLSGTGDVTIYCGNKNTINFNCYFASNTAAPEFTGTLYLKTLDGYSCDTITFASGWPGSSADGISYTKTSGQWGSIPFTMDITGAGSPVLYVASGHSAWPKITGEGTIYIGNRFAFWRNRLPSYYDVTIEGGASGNNDFEIYPGATIAFNAPVTAINRYAYHRTGQLLLINSQVPSFSNIANGFSLRDKNGSIGGDGYIDTSVGGKDGSTINVYPGHDGANSIGVLTVKSLWLYNNNGVAFDFDGQTSDKIVSVDSANFSGSNTRVWLNLMENFLDNPKVGNYKMLDGKCVTAMQPVNDTLGYYVVDSVMSYIHVPTGDTITYYSKIFRGMGNREIDTLAFWGLGTGTGADYVPSPNKISAEDWQLGTYSADARAAIEARQFMPYTNDTIKYLDENGHKLTGTDLPILGAYDFIYNFNLDVKNNAMKLKQPTGDSLSIARDFFHFTFKNTETDPETNEEKTVMRYTTNRFTRTTFAENGVDTVKTEYWFDFTYFFTNGVIALCSEEYPEVDLNREYNNGPSDINTVNKETHAVLNRTIYTIDGKRVNTYVKGLNIVTTRYTDGTIETKKVFFRE